MNTEHLLNAALALHNKGNLREAEKHYRAILSSNPNHIDALHYLGVIAFQVGQCPAAIELIRKSISLHSKNAPALSNLANAYQGNQDYANAVKYYEKSLSLDTNNVHVRANYGNALKQLNSLSEAQTQYLRVLQSAPNLHEVKRNLAEVYAARGELAKAIALINDALRNAQASTELLTTYGNLLQQAGDYHSASEKFSQALSLSPTSATAKTNLGKCLAKAGKTEQAISVLSDAAHNAPQSSEAQYDIANLYYELGEFAQARQYLEKSIVLNNQNSNAQALMVKCSANAEQAAAHISVIEGLLEQGNISAKDKIHLLYCLGNYYEKTEKLERSFDYFSKANTLSRQQVSYNVDDDMNALANIIKVFNADFFANNSYQADTMVSPIFIVGMPRSGSSLVEQIISSHSKVTGAGEVPLLATCLDSVLGLKYGIDCTAKAANATPETWQEIAQSYTHKIANYAQKNSVVCDKLLMNFFHIGIIKLLFPNAIIIHCTRQPIATCWSIYKSNFADKGHYYGQTFAELAQFYAGYEALMAHWHTLFENQIIEVSYEALVADQEQESRKLIAACQLDWEDACLEFYKNKRRVGTLSAAQVRRPIYRSGVDSYKQYEPYIAELVTSLQSNVKQLITR